MQFSYRPRHLKFLGTLILLAFVLIGWRSEWFIFTPEIKTPIGKFQINNKSAVGDIGEDVSNILPDSIYTVLYDLYHEKTSLGRKNSFEKYKDFEVIDSGNIVDIGTDGKTIVLMGVKDGKTSALACVFLDKWKKRLNLMKPGDSISYRGTISDYDQNLVFLDSCEIVK